VRRERREFSYQIRTRGDPDPRKPFDVGSERFLGEGWFVDHACDVMARLLVYMAWFRLLLTLWSTGVAHSVKPCQISQYGPYEKPIAFSKIFPNLTVPLNFDLIKNGILSMDPQQTSLLPQNFDSFFHKLSCGEDVAIMVTGVSQHSTDYPFTFLSWTCRGHLQLELGQQAQELISNV
jgi:hypothetical protein